MNNKTLQDIYLTLNEEQKKLVLILFNFGRTKKFNRIDSVETILNLSVCEGCPYKQFMLEMKDRLNKMKGSDT